MLKILLRPVVAVSVSLVLLVTSIAAIVMLYNSSNNRYICESNFNFAATIAGDNYLLSGNYGISVGKEDTVSISVDGIAQKNDENYILNRKLTYHYERVDTNNIGAVLLTLKGNDKMPSDDTPEKVATGIFLGTPKSGRLVLVRNLDKRTLLIGPASAPTIACAISKL